MSKEGTLATGHVVKFQQAVDLLPRPRARSNGRVIVGAIALRGEGGEFSSTFSSNWFDGITMVRHGMPACPITVPVNFFRHFSLLLRSCISLVSIPHTVSFAQVTVPAPSMHQRTAGRQMYREASESTPNQTEPTPFVVRPARFALSFLFVMSQSFKSFLLSRDSLGGSTSLLRRHAVTNPMYPGHAHTAWGVRPARALGGGAPGNPTIEG